MPDHDGQAPREAALLLGDAFTHSAVPREQAQYLVERLLQIDEEEDGVQILECLLFELLKMTEATGGEEKGEQK